RRLAPGPAPLALGQARAVRARFADRRGFPFGLGRKPALGPVAPGVRLIPSDERHRRVRRELLDFVVAAPRPAAAVILEPVDRLFGRYALAPGPTRGAPEFPSAINAVTDERGELGIRNPSFGNPERRDVALVCPLLVIEDEALDGGRAEPPAPAGHLDVAAPCAGTMTCRTPKIFRPRESERLSRIGERLDVHIFVPDREVVEIAGREVDPAAEAVNLMLEHIRHVSEHAVAVGQIQVPAGCVGDRAGIPQAVRTVEDRRFAVSMPQRPVFVEPADVPDLPEYGIDDRQHRSHQLPHRQIVRHATGVRAYTAELGREFVGCGAARRPIYWVFVHEDRCYHTSSFVVTVRKPDHQYALDADLARAWPSRSHRPPIWWSGRGPDDCHPRVAQRGQHPELSRALPRSAAGRGFERHRRLRLYRSRPSADSALACMRRSTRRVAGARAAARARAVSSEGSRR